VIALVDYGGNIGSVRKAIEYLGAAADVISVQAADAAARLRRAEKIVLPGQGHFGVMVHALAESGLKAALSDQLAAGTPFFGICLGLQVLYEGSDEAPGAAGLGLLRGLVKRLQAVPAPQRVSGPASGTKVPHVGWSQLEIRKPASRLLHGIPDGSFFYYCHSYYGPVTAETCAVTEYGSPFAAAVEHGHVWAVQFHPEKSGQAGLQVLMNFLNL
jgi:glutamine amidotransferase